MTIITYLLSAKPKKANKTKLYNCFASSFKKISADEKMFLSSLSKICKENKNDTTYYIDVFE